MGFKTKRDALWFISGYKTAFMLISSAIEKVPETAGAIASLAQDGGAAALKRFFDTMGEAIPDEVPNFRTVKQFDNYVCKRLGIVYEEEISG